ncbi:hypothetical protein AAIP36_001880 [Flavobacterium psychrophilum]
MTVQNPDYNEKYIILKKATLRPDKLVFYTQFVKRNQPEKIKKTVYTQEEREELLSIGLPIRTIPESNKHNFDISIKAGQRIREKITWLYTLAKNQTITTHNNKILYSFKMNFITLTLPSIQVHTTDILTKECLNQFITECSLKFGMKNYVWRLEYQKNGNAHYHIATDCYIEYWKCKKIWNRVLNKLGYVSAYAAKFSKYSFSDYYKEFHKQGNEDYKILRSRFDAGVVQNWQEPNTVDCRNVTSSKNIAYYISKYITKNSNEKINPIISERENTNSNIRLWFCSRSLSRLTKIEIFLDNISTVKETILEGLTNFKTYIHDYCDVIYFSAKEQTTIVKQSLWLSFHNYAKENGYFSTS